MVKIYHKILYFVINFYHKSKYIGSRDYIKTVHFFPKLVIAYFPYRHYFALPTNPGEQFFLFSSLAAWLIRKCGIKFDSPQEVLVLVLYNLNNELIKYLITKLHY